jgi:hypothetical protein
MEKSHRKTKLLMTTRTVSRVESVCEDKWQEEVASYIVAEKSFEELREKNSRRGVCFEAENKVNNQLEIFS